MSLHLPLLLHAFFYFIYLQLLIISFPWLSTFFSTTTFPLPSLCYRLHLPLSLLLCLPLVSLATFPSICPCIPSPLPPSSSYYLPGIPVHCLPPLPPSTLFSLSCLPSGGSSSSTFPVYLLLFSTPRVCSPHAQYTIFVCFYCFVIGCFCFLLPCIATIL